MRGLLIVLISTFSLPGWAQQADLSSSQVQEFVNSRIQNVGRAPTLTSKRKRATELYDACYAMKVTEENVDAVSNCRAGLRCFGSSFLEFKLGEEDCKGFVQKCERYFLGGTARPPGEKIQPVPGSAEVYGFQMLSALGCPVPTEYLQDRQPNSKVAPASASQPKKK